ncbi:hypothetical protein PHYBLDRAFT_162550 [Phycomyces blakesleeanus NRRL 1555(-)]|uniref:Uncharacterized protein n=1 Tax=Phycomyces blakesleeanus (strain ATCC 8743b / DSM 1359 / FGSC 10004 / NBRC 33097 / NRRL 1555) TaxID=763407 RepID=A0A167QCI9_PHYB8|nr:hypothetical protein PHYBLDRAFT_162550 [Phycomyces blakesleeanus NRRL 1555(-)]OAD79484.1 hypothetical protein PHYBLDRAFT_162550 [Phycomyces blakesleeanus NRRL 1555(-)]|eukprot:XP_018297524.1 hypothetical protein PHYBLDRAFT_162550 [Phycomyces blakesleeanus NRRL 1555(-)]
MTDKRTAKRHAQNDNDRKIDKIINVLTAKVNTSETDMDVDQIEEYVEDDNHSVGAPSPEQYVHIYLPLLVEESLFGTEEYTSEYESEYESSDEIEPEEQDREEEQESTANLPENPWHEVIAIFTVMFISTFIMDDSAVILITFINTILEHYGEDFRLPISILGLKKMTGYNDLMNRVSNYVKSRQQDLLWKQALQTQYKKCNDSQTYCGISECIYCLTSVGVTIMTSNHKSALGLPTKLAPYRSDTVYPAMIATTLSQYEYVLICDKSNIRVSGSPHLHQLMYFEPVHATVIDPMHNLFLGMAKCMMDNWIACDLLDSNDFAEMQKEADSMTLPMGALTKPAITEEEIDKAHVSLEKFCCSCETMYKLDLLLPNMHLHLHLKESIQDFGPICSFWLFSFECFNGVLKGFQTNQKSGFKKTYMKKFVEDSSKGDFYHTHLSTINNPSYISVFNKLTDSITGTIPSGNHQNLLSFFHLSSFLESTTNPEQQTFGNEPLPPSALPLALKEATTMRKAEYGCLLKLYKIEYDDDTLCSAKTMLRHRIFVNDRIQKIASINLLRQVYKGGEGLIMRGSYIQAKYMGTNNNSKGIYAGYIK